MALKLAYDQFMPNMYTYPKDLQDRLDGTVIRYKSKPFYCRTKVAPDGAMVLYLYGMSDMKRITPALIIKPDDPELDISIIESMYVNYKHSSGAFEIPQRACWLTRNTSKHFKSGTYCGYSTINTVDGKRSPDFVADTIVFSKEFEFALEGKYPEVSQQLELMKGMKRHEYEVAVGQRVALKRESIGLIKVYIDTKIVGWLDGQDKVIVTNDDRRWVIIRMLNPLGFKI